MSSACYDARELQTGWWSWQTSPTLRTTWERQTIAATQMHTHTHRQASRHTLWWWNVNYSPHLGLACFKQSFVQFYCLCLLCHLPYVPRHTHSSSLLLSLFVLPCYFLGIPGQSSKLWVYGREGFVRRKIRDTVHTCTHSCTHTKSAVQHVQSPEMRCNN